MTFFFPLPSNSQMLLYHYHISFLLLLFIYFFSHYLTYFSFFLKRRKSTYFSWNLLTFCFTLSITCRVYLDWTYCYWKLKTENWKYCNKIIFKYMNSTVGPIFNKKFDKKLNLWVRKQYTNILSTEDRLKVLKTRP